MRLRASAALLAIAIVLAFARPTAAQSITTQKGFLKSSIAEFEEPDRSVLLGFLAECRKVSDSLAKTLSTGDRGKASKMTSPEATQEWQGVADVLKAVQRETPSTTLQYRNQALELVGRKEVLTSRVWYALINATPTEARNFVSVVVEQSPSGHAGRVIAIQALGYSEAVPTWLLRVDAPVAPAQ